SAPGSVSQVRECTGQLMRIAKTNGIPVCIVGHVTKEGSIAGPRLLEHMVDAVLYFEGERHHMYRILRGVKNRFGSTHEMGIFERAVTRGCRVNCCCFYGGNKTCACGDAGLNITFKLRKPPQDGYRYR